jgi:hypothetical protein
VPFGAHNVEFLEPYFRARTLVSVRYCVLT